METPEQRPERRPWHTHFETVGSITAIVVGVAALLVSWDQGRVMREEVRASVWPALQLDGFVAREEDRLGIGLTVRNAGVGPALVQRIAIYHHDGFVPDLDALRALLPADADLSQATMRGRIIGAGDAVEAFRIRYPVADDVDALDVAGELFAAWRVEVCYCSSLRQCWLADGGDGMPEEVGRCEGGDSSRL